MEIEQIYEKWSKALHLHKLDEDVGRNTAILLQNAQLIHGDSKNSPEWKRLLFPFIRRVAPNLLINKIGSLQPAIYQNGGKKGTHHLQSQCLSRPESHMGYVSQ